MGTRSGISATAAPDRGIAWQPFAAAALAAVAGGVGWAIGETPAEQAILIARFTARVSLGLFLIVYLAKPLARLMPSPPLAALQRDWSHWLYAFVVAHSLHFATMLHLFAARGITPDAKTLALGGLAYALPIAVALTLGGEGGREWRRWLRRFGIHFVWLSFAVTYYHRLFEFPDRRTAGAFAFVLLIAALAVRIVAAFKAR